MKNICSILPTMMGASYRALSLTLLRVVANSESSLMIFANCFGQLSVDVGHRRLPKPPARITGRIFTSGVPVICTNLLLHRNILIVYDLHRVSTAIRG